jgi:uncharacterized phage-associated protein
MALGVCAVAAETVYDARGIASYLLGKAGTAGLDALQVMKLTYIAHGFTLGAYGKPLLEDDIEAWKYGPVIRRLYSNIPAGRNPFNQMLRPVEAPEMQPADRDVVDMVFDKYGKLSGLFLSTLTHRVGSPWHQTWLTYGQDAVIPKEVIRKHYETMIAAWNAAAAKGCAYFPEAL